MRAYINNKPFDFDQEITILEAARQMGFFIPTLCAFKPLSVWPGPASRAHAPFASFVLNVQTVRN
jgi:hypothetical protein